MFATNPALRLEIPSALMEVDVWDSLEIVMPEPFLVVTTSERMAEGGNVSRTFLAKAHHLAPVRRSRNMRIQTVDLLSPARVNGSGRWRLDRLNEVWECRDADETHTCWLFRTASGTEFCDSLVGHPPSTLLKDRCVFSTELRRKRSGTGATSENSRRQRKESAAQNGTY